MGIIPYRNTTSPKPKTTAPTTPLFITEAPPVNCVGTPVPVGLPEGVIIPPVETIIGLVAFSAQEGAGTGERVTRMSAGGEVGHPAWETVRVEVCAAEGDWLGR